MYISDEPNVCYVCGYLGVRVVYCFVTKVTSPNYWCVCGRAWIRLNVPCFCEEHSQAAGTDGQLAQKNGSGSPFLGEEGI